MAGLKYDQIIKYKIKAICDGPLHIGSSVGGKEEVLIHPVDGLPFVQASGIAGAFRSTYAGTHSKEATNRLFGADRVAENTKAADFQSRVKFSDGVFVKDTVKMELRPHVSIDKASGTVKTSNRSGQKFDMEYVGAGAKLELSVYVFIDSADEGADLEKEMESLMAELQAGSIEFGAKKSSGAGRILAESIVYKVFNLKNAKDRVLWLKEESLEETEYKPLEVKVNNTSAAYTVFIKGRTEGAILVKGLAVSEFGENAPDAENIKNAKNEYIIPGSSFRGAIRAQMEKISMYLGKTTVIEDSFGKAGETQEDSHAGNLVFQDAIIGSENTIDILRHRIHIDKFTGGVMHGGKFSERNAAGNVDLRIQIKNRRNPDATMGLLVLALRDLAAKTMNLGGGYAIGKGFIDVETIIIQKGEEKAEIKFGDQVNLQDPSGMIDTMLHALREVQ